MTEKRYKVNIDHCRTSRNYVSGILDCETNVLLDNHTAINNRLNEQHETITRLKTINKGKEQLSSKQDKIIRLLYTQCKEFKEMLDDMNIAYLMDERLEEFMDNGVELE